jgi:hypothetical protein
MQRIVDLTATRARQKLCITSNLQILFIKRSLDLSPLKTQDVENKFASLEHQFRVAMDWAENTGQGVDDPGDFQAAVLKQCPYYIELDPIMGEYPNARPLNTNEGEFEEDGPLLLRLLFPASRAIDQSGEDSAPVEPKADLLAPGDLLANTW